MKLNLRDGSFFVHICFSFLGLLCILERRLLVKKNVYFKSNKRLATKNVK